jgi:hypothetical protein
MLRLVAPCLFVLVAMASPAVHGEDGWLWHSKREGVTVWTRARPGTMLREIRARGVIRATPSAVLAAIADVGHYPEFMPPTEQARLLKRKGNTAWYHVVLSPPVVAKRDYCVRTSWRKLSEGRFLSEWSLDDTNCPPPAEGVQRMVDNHGRWLLIPEDEGRATLVLYELFTDPGGSIPAGLVNEGSCNALPDVYVALRKVSQGPAYAGCGLDVARCLVPQ